MISTITGVHHTAISVRNVENSVIFYEQLGFVKTDHNIEPDGSLQIIQMTLNGMGLELFWYAKNNHNAPLSLGYAGEPDVVGVKNLCLQVMNADDALLQLQKKGLANGQTQIKTARSLANSCYFFIKDPDGMWVGFMEDNRNKESE